MYLRMRPTLNLRSLLILTILVAIYIAFLGRKPLAKSIRFWKTTSTRLPSESRTDKNKNDNTAKKMDLVTSFQFNSSKLRHDPKQYCHRVKPGAEDVGYPEVLMKRSFRNDVRFVFFMGLEGAGHRFFSQIVRACPNCHCPPSVEGFQVASNSMRNGIFGTNSTKQEFKENTEIFLKRLPAALQKFREKNGRNENVTFVMNILCKNDGWAIGEMSYPNFMTECRTQAIPDVRLFAELFETLGYDFRVVVLLRDVVELLHQNIRKGITTLEEIVNYASIVENDMVKSQLLRLDSRFYRCLDFDELPFVAEEVGAFLNIDNQNDARWTLSQQIKKDFKPRPPDSIAQKRSDYLKQDTEHQYLKLEHSVHHLREICARAGLYITPKMKWCRDTVLNHGIIPILKNKNDSVLFQKWQALRCGDMFCDSIDQSQCHWNQFSVRSFIPDEENKERLCDSFTISRFIMPREWVHYQFNDLFKGKWLENFPNPGSAWREHFPAEDTLFGEYHRRAVAKGIAWENYELLHEVVNEFERNVTPPPSNAVVVHLRLGDVIDASQYSVSDLLLRQRYFYEKEAQWDAYVRPLRHFSSLPYVPHVILLGGIHFGQTITGPNATKSCLYVRAIQKYFEARGSKVTLRLGNSPDVDVLFASQSAMFAQAGGGFSKTIAKLVRRHGGKVFYPKYNPNP